MALTVIVDDGNSRRGKVSQADGGGGAIDDELQGDDFVCFEGNVIIKDVRRDCLQVRTVHVEDDLLVEHHPKWTNVSLLRGAWGAMKDQSHQLSNQQKLSHLP